MATTQYIRYPATSGGGSGTVTSVGLALPASVFTVTGSPVTTTGTLTGSFISQSANQVLASPDGSSGVPTFRALVAADLPTGNLTDAGIDGITVTGGTGAVIGSGTSIAQHVADSTHNGYLSSTDWSTFNAKQPAGNYITALTGDATATGPGSVPITLATVNASPGSFGSASAVTILTVNGKGLVTTASSTSIQIAESQVTNLVSDLAGKQPVGNYITALTGDVTATGPGSIAASLVATTNSTITTLSALSLPFSQTTGTVPINRGGTGQTTQTAGFDALSPTTTKADLIVNDGTNNVRFPVGTDGYIIIADSTAPQGLMWAQPAQAQVIAAAATFVGPQTVTALNYINFDTVLYDTNSAITTGTGTTWKFDTTSTGAGFYLVTIQTNTSGAGTQPGTNYILVNGFAGTQYPTTFNGTNPNSLSGAATVRCATAGDLISIGVDATATYTNGMVTITKIGS